MGTNYYLVPRPDCESCHRRFDSDHIGKLSIGWRFLFRAYPQESVTSVPAWKIKIAIALRTGGRIEDEYGTTISEEDFWKMVESRAGLRPHAELSYHYRVWTDEGSDLVDTDFS